MEARGGGTSRTLTPTGGLGFSSQVGGKPVLRWEPRGEESLWEGEGSSVGTRV